MITKLDIANMSQRELEDTIKRFSEYVEINRKPILDKYDGLKKYEEKLIELVNEVHRRAKGKGFNK